MATSASPAFDTIYNAEFCYPLPRSSFEKMYKGRMFSAVPYTQEECARLTTYCTARLASMPHHASTEKIAVITVGAPGSGVETLAQQLLEEEYSQGYSFPYTDTSAHMKDLETPESTTDWIDAAHATHHWLLANLIKQGSSFYTVNPFQEDPTSFYAFLKSQEYKIHIVYLTAPEAVCCKELQTPEALEHWKTEATRIHAQVARSFDHADKIFFDYRPTEEDKTVCTAIWTRGDSPAPGSFRLLHLKHFSTLSHQHGKHCWPEI